MEGRVRISCDECGRSREVVGEMPDEYIRCFQQVVAEDGFVPRPGVAPAFICGTCLRQYEGHETREDEDKVQGRRGAKEL